MKTVCQTSRCSGCNACEAICPKNAINQTERDGFLYPFINEDLCNGCGLCEKVCPTNRSIILNERKHEFKAVKLKKDRKKSQSGGASWALVKYIINEGGVVYGCVSLDDQSVEITRLEKLEDAEKTRKVKYVQANFKSEGYCSVASDLEKGKIVLFTATPCQIDGVLRYLEVRKVNTQRLITADLICHGVPSQIVFLKYIDLISKQYGKSIKEYVYRDKQFGWGSYVETIIFEDDTKKHVDMWRQLFHSNKILRSSCGSCQYANMNRVSDITIGDCWNIYLKYGEFADKQGVSTLIINSEKGKLLFEKVQCYLDVIDINEETALQPSLISPTEMPEDYTTFWKDYETLSFEEFYQKYVKHNEIIKWRYFWGMYKNGILRRLKK